MAKRILGLDLDHRSSRSFALWFGLLGPPLAWGAHLLMGDGIFEFGCAKSFTEKAIFGVSLTTWAVIETALMAAITVLAGVLSFRAWQRLRTERDGTSHDRATAMAVMGMASGVFYLLIILFGFLPSILLRACETSL
ncbi:MAG TPA: hypothetical protein VGL18_06190 [Actinomycetota bacterium]|jgi:hypothetical protein